MSHSPRQISHSVLGTSSNLLGICFFMLGFMKKTDIGKSSHLDECLIFPIAAFFAASFLSYLSIRSKEGSENKFERYADTFFMTGLTFLTLLAFGLILEIFI